MTDIAEELFPPRAGGMVDSHRQAAAHAAQAAPDMTAEPAIGLPAVRTQAESPERFSARTIVLPASAGSQLLLGQDANRRRATIIALDAPVVLAASRMQADDPRNAVTAAGLGAGGYVLPAGVPLATEARGELWAAPVSASVLQAAQVTSQVTGAPVTSPGAGAIIATMNLPASGTWQLAWIVNLGGTLGAIDRDNMGLYVNGVLVATAITGISPNAWPQAAAVTVQATAGQAVSVQAIGAGTVASVYVAQVVATLIAATPAATRVSVVSELYTPAVKG